MKDKPIRPTTKEIVRPNDGTKQGNDRPAPWPPVPQPLRDEIQPAKTPPPNQPADTGTGS